ncbi:hypothetical protein AWC38_SpisGene16869 [Stylophora pistillata]|uniref:Uncharacterized protein n=1 Tax=Stylophora pistillata TaxID=50429 RepID=A0A2B4RNJ4_STYPI|nr:hypothetical protein AWC38_SpisGene16869 [Stylophora pistillata]
MSGKPTPNPTPEPSVDSILHCNVTRVSQSLSSVVEDPDDEVVGSEQMKPFFTRTDVLFIFKFLELPTESATMAAGVFCCDDFRLEGLLHCNVTRYQRPRFRRTTNEASINKDRSVFRILFFGVITICSRYEPKTDLFTRINKAQSF